MVGRKSLVTVGVVTLRCVWIWVGLCMIPGTRRPPSKLDALHFSEVEEACVGGWVCIMKRRGVCLCVCVSVFTMFNIPTRVGILFIIYNVHLPTRVTGVQIAPTIHSGPLRPINQQD